MVTKLVALIFVCFFIQDAVCLSYLQPYGKSDDHDQATADQQNSGKIWNWSFGKPDSPATNEGKPKTKTPSENLSPAGDRNFNVKKNPSELADNKVGADDSNTSAAHFKESSPKRLDPRYAVPKQNSDTLTNVFNDNNKNNNDKKNESEEYDFDDTRSEDDEPYNSEFDNSQSNDDDDDDDDDHDHDDDDDHDHDDDDDDDHDHDDDDDDDYEDDDDDDDYEDDDDDDSLSPENKNKKGNESSPDVQAKKGQHPMRGSKVAPQSGLPGPMEQPAMQTRSLQMRTLRGKPDRFKSNEACSRFLQRLMQVSQTQQPLRNGVQNSPATTVPPNTLIPQMGPTGASFTPGNNLPGTNPAVLNNPNGRRAIDGTPPFNYARSISNGDWPSPNLLYSSIMNYRNPSNSKGPSSTWNTKQFNAAYRSPKMTSDVSSEDAVTEAIPRSLDSILPGIMNAGTGLLPSLVNPSNIGSSLTRIPSDVTRGVTSSLFDVTQGLTSSLSDLTPTGVRSSLSSIPRAASDLSSGVNSALSPSNYWPSSTLSSIPGLIYLASSFADWMKSNSTLSNTRSNLSSPFSFVMSYIPGLLSAISVILPFLPSFGSTSQPTPPTIRSPLSTIASLPSSLLGLTGLTSSGRNGPYGYENKDSGRKDKFGDDFDYENDLKNGYADERGDRMDDRYQQSKKGPSSSQRIRNSKKPFAGPHRRDNRNQNLYNYEEGY